MMKEENKQVITIFNNTTTKYRLVPLYNFLELYI